jgi:hypothetical protein
MAQVVIHNAARCSRIKVLYLVNHNFMEYYDIQRHILLTSNGIYKPYGIRLIFLFFVSGDLETFQNDK